MMMNSDASRSESADPARDLPVMSGPAEYRIRLHGHLDPETSSRLCGLTIQPGRDETGEPVTTLHGVLVDQAALAGVLSTLYAYQLPILSVECLGAKE